MRIKRAIFLALLAIVVFLTIKNGELWLRRLLIYLSHAGWARQIVSTLPAARQVARRFVAGETVDEAMNAASTLNQQGKLATLDYLGESVSDAREAEAARDEILHLLDQISHRGLKANVSVKLTQLGLRIDRDLAFRNMVAILEKARSNKNKVRIDMEESDLVDATLGIYRELRDYCGFENVGVVIQAYLYRSEADVRWLVAEGAWIRLCKGAYAEPAEIAFPDKADTDRNFVKLLELMLSNEACRTGVHLAIATHDVNVIEAALQLIGSRQIPDENYEFQMLYGIRRDIQDRLAGKGYRVRVYVPYGTAWYPYLVRRLAERPANLWFFVSNILKK